MNLIYRLGVVWMVIGLTDAMRAYFQWKCLTATEAMWVFALGTAAFFVGTFIDAKGDV